MKHNETQFTCLNSSINPTIYLSNIMSSVFYYEPFYDFDRFLDEALSTRIGSASDNAVARRNDSSDSGAARNMKPRYVCLRVNRPTCSLLTRRSKYGFARGHG